MLLSLPEVQRIAADVAQSKDPKLEVVAAITSVAGSPYTEVTVTIHGCQREPCVLVIGAERNASESKFRSEVAEKLQQHLDQHRSH